MRWYDRKTRREFRRLCGWRFAIIPVHVKDEWIWLEWYMATEEWTDTME